MPVTGLRQFLDRRLFAALLAVMAITPAALTPIATTHAASVETMCDSEVNLLTNGDFESPVVTNEDNWDVFPSPVDGWTVEWLDATPADDKPTTAHLEIHKNSFFASASGSQFAELDTNWTGPDGSVDYPHPASVRAYQDVSTIPGATYAISVYFSPRPGYDAADNILDISWGDAVLDTVTGDGSELGNTSWVEHTYTVTATGATTRLMFADAGFPNSFGTFIDNASVRCMSVPDSEVTTLTVIKTVVNDDAGERAAEDFVLQMVNNESEPVSFTGSATGTVFTMVPGTYAVTEDASSDYVATYSEACSGTIALGENLICTVTNDDVDGIDQGGNGDNDDSNRRSGSRRRTVSFAPEGQVLGASTSTVTCSEYLLEYIWYGRATNNPEEVKKLQLFLNEHMGSTLPITGYYGPMTHEVLNQFQVKYGTDVLAPWMPFGHAGSSIPTGHVYKTTRWMINQIKCPALATPTPILP